VAFIADLSGAPEAWSIPARGGWPNQLTFVGDRVSFAAFSPRDERLIVGTDVGGDENVQLGLLSASGESLLPLMTRLDAMHPFGDWSPDGQQIAYASNERNRAHFDVVVQHVDSGEARTVLASDGVYAVDAWSPDGQRLLVSRVDSSSNNDLFELAVETGELVLASSHQGAARFQQATYRADGRAIYALTDLDRDYLMLAELDLATGGWRPLVEDTWDVELFAISPDGNSIAYSTNVAGFSKLSILNRQSRATTPIELPAGVIARGFVGNLRDGLTWSPDGHRLAFSLTTARLTQNVWLADPDSGAAWPITHATVAAIPTEAMVEPELIHYPTFDGRSIPAYLFSPTGHQPTGDAAAVVLIHGGPESQSRPGFDPTVQYLANQGYVVIVPNVRGSTGYGNAYSHLDDVEKRMDAVADAKFAADWLAQSHHAHPRKIAAMGQSYGGFMVLASLATYPETWAAGVNLYGVANFVTFFENTHPFRRRHRAAEYGSLEEHRELLVEISPMTHLHRVIAPLLVAHGEQDIRVPITETEQVVAALRARGVPIEFIRLPHAGHGIVRLEDKLLVYPAIAEFLARHLEVTR